MNVRYLTRNRAVALTLWGVTCLLPGVLIGTSRTLGAVPRTQQLTAFYGREVAAYLNYCPEPLLAYVMPLLFFTPVLLLLSALTDDRRATPVIDDALRAAVGWAAINAAAMAFLGSILVVRHRADDALGGWLFSIWFSLFFSGLPSLGFAAFIAKSFRSRRTALIVGLLGACVLGFVGICARKVGLLWVPGALDQLLFAGETGRRWRGASVACMWLLFWTAIAHLRLKTLLRSVSAAQPE